MGFGIHYSASPPVDSALLKSICYAKCRRCSVPCPTTSFCSHSTGLLRTKCVMCRKARAEPAQIAAVFYTVDMFSAFQNANFSKFLPTFHAANAVVAQKGNSVFLKLFMVSVWPFNKLIWKWWAKVMFQAVCCYHFAETRDHCGLVRHGGLATLNCYQCTQAFRRKNGPTELKRQGNRVCNDPCGVYITINNLKQNYPSA